MSTSSRYWFIRYFESRPTDVIITEIKVITVPTRSAEDGPKWFGYIMAGCYIRGGLLILFKKRWLWIIGLVVNTLIIAIFFMIYSRKPEIIFSFPGLVTKIAQILLEVGLVYVIAAYRDKNQLSSQTR